MAVPEPKTSNGRVRETEDALDIGNMLTQTARAYRQAVNAEIAQNGVTIRQSQVLGWLQKNGNLSQIQTSEVAQDRTRHSFGSPGAYGTRWPDPTRC